MAAKITEEKFISLMNNLNAEYVKRYEKGLRLSYRETESLSHMKKTTARRHIKRFVQNDIPSPYARIKRILAQPHGTTKMGLLLRYHFKEEVNNRWGEYRNKQAYTNTFEYKREKYNWSEDDYNRYNQSRAVTLDNMISRHGIQLGHRKWQTYVDQQRYAGTSLSYFIEKYGLENGQAEYENVNRSKAHNLENMILRHGPERGPVMWEEYVMKSSPMWSKVSQSLFAQLDTPDAYYATSNKAIEYGVTGPCGRHVKLDYMNEAGTHAIEFHGDFWHAHPDIYDADHILMGMKASDIWLRDENKRTIIETRNIKLLVVWESEFVEDPEGCIHKCKEFLKTNL